ncbi:MAG TPA: hypothetical protein DD706_23665 [Nitrospiraceae bacterium]|nr:hypothetical protein [Nitrospiraceae bacterium]
MIEESIAVSCGVGGIGQFAKQVEEFHVVQGAWRSAGDSGITNHNGQALRPGDGDIHPVAVKDKGQTA